jgi:hypothetical protein
MPSLRCTLETRNVAVAAHAEKSDQSGQSVTFGNSVSLTAAEVNDAATGGTSCGFSMNPHADHRRSMSLTAGVQASAISRPKR